MAKLIYQAGFEDTAFTPLTDALGLGPLQITQSPELPGSAQTEVLQPSGLRLTLTRTVLDEMTDPNKVDCYVGAIVPFRDDIDLFKITATFQLPEWNSAATKYAWGMALFVRKTDYPTNDQRTTVTLQSSLDESGHLVGKMNTPAGWPDNPAPEIPGIVRAAIFEPDHPGGSTFTLELLIDRRKQVARGEFVWRGRWLEIRYSKHHWFRHRLINPWKPGDPIGPIEPDDQVGDRVGPIESAGFAIAITRQGLGTASATATDFRIYTLSWLDVLLAKLSGIFNGRRF